MKTGIGATLQKMLDDTRIEIASDKSRHSPKRIKQMIRGAAPVLSFSSALSTGHALIAEIKERSPSQGKMRSQNVEDAPYAYKQSRFVKAISVLTNRTHFGQGMRLERLRKIKETTGKPVLRKDFIFDEYQIYQSRAYGADAILLMANILEADELRNLSTLAFDLGMDVLFETHSVAELNDIPPAAKLIGINCRNFSAGGLRPANFKIARFFRQWLGTERDHSVNTARFQYADKLPENVLKVAESGVTAKTCEEVFRMGFHAILVGTSLLMDRRGVSPALREFEAAISPLGRARSAQAALSLRPVSA